MLHVSLYLELYMTFLFYSTEDNIAWDHLSDIYSKSRMESGLVLFPCLKYEHIHLTSFSKMRVDLAAQVRLHNIF